MIGPNPPQTTVRIKASELYSHSAPANKNASLTETGTKRTDYNVVDIVSFWVKTEHLMAALKQAAFDQTWTL